jgi:hypothetical protein
MGQRQTFYQRCIGTFVQRGSKFCFVVLLVLVLVGTFVRILHFRLISPCFQLVSILQHCPAAMPGSSALKYYKFHNCKLFYGRRPACSIAYFLASSLVQAFPACN